MNNRFQVVQTQNGLYQIRDSANHDCLVASPKDAPTATKLCAELNQVAITSDELGIRLLTEDDS